jgi:hypothetical protein
MLSRRVMIVSLAGAAASIPILDAFGARAVFPGPATDDTPKATVIKGTPPILDFGDGLQIACNKSAFLTLWEGKGFWLTFGAGRSTYHQQAQGQAVNYAQGAMKLLLMTLAFAPDRMVQVNGGWHLKVQDMRYYVKGDVQLPGVPYWPITDADFMGFRDLDSPGLLGPPSAGGITTPSWDPAVSSNAKVDAYTTFVVLKRNVSLDYVRQHAQVLLQ